MALSKLTISLKSDTGSSSTDKLTNIGLLNITGVATGATVQYSVDGGLTWTARTTGVTSGLRGVTQFGGRYVVVGDNGTIITSTDLNTWTAATSGTTQTLRRVTAGNQLVAVGSAGTVLLSTDGLTWTAGNSGTTGDIRGLLRGILFEYLYVGAGGLNAISR